MAYYRAVAHAAAPAPERIGVLVVNLGTPDSPSYIAVLRYLRDFLGDRRNFRKIWMQGGSPLAIYSKRLADKIENRLQASLGDGLRVALGMTYGNPSIASAIKALAELNVRRLLVLPLYPQYCSATTGSVFDRSAEALRRWRWLPETRFVNDYHDDPGYLDALAGRIDEHWRQIGERSHLLFSYHATRAAYVKEGDPYQAQTEATTRLVARRLGLGPDDYSHCYQSRFGSIARLQPYIEHTLEALAKRGVRKLTIVSPSVAVDCLETPEEIGLTYRDQFKRLGGERLTLVPALNDHDSHAAALAALVQRQIQGWTGR